MKALRVFVAVAILLCVTRSVGAGTKIVDGRNVSTADADVYFVVFCARTGSATGHAFVAWGVEDGGRAMSQQEAYGFYPEGDGGVFGTVPGEIRDEAFNSKTALVTDRLIVRVTKVQFEETLRIYPQWQTRDYNLFTTNCVAFTAAVARALGINVPDKTSFRFPSDFVSTLIARN